MTQNDINRVPELVSELIRNEKWDFYKTCFLEQELCRKQTPNKEILKILYVSKAEAINILRVYFNTFNGFFNDNERAYFERLNQIDQECEETVEKYKRIAVVMDNYYLFLDSNFDETFTHNQLYIE